MPDERGRVTSTGRTVVRNRRFQLVGAVSLVLAVGFAVLIAVVVASPGESLDHPGGFTVAGRALAVVGCALAAAAFAAYAIGSLRVALIIDETALVIRNPWRTTVVRWESKPRFEIRGRRQDVTVESPGTGSPPKIKGRMTYRYSEIICTVGRQRIWIAATSRMSSRDRIGDTLKELRDASGRNTQKAAAQPESSG